MSLFDNDEDDGPSTSASTTFAGSSSGTSKASSSRLTSLFAQDDQIRSSGNQSLTFTAKKLTTNAPPGATAPTNAATPSSSSTSGNSSLLYACPVFLIKYDAQRKPSNVGQRAVALLRGSNPSQCQMIVYDPATANQKQEFTSSVSEHFGVSITFPTYVAFYDENPNGKNYWCFQFANAESLEGFVKHVALIKHATTIANTPTWSGVITLDLVTGATDSGRAVANGDAVKYKYSINLLAATHPKGVGALVGVVGSDEKPKMLKLGAQKDLLGIEQALVGMRKGGRRFALIHYSLAYGGNAVGNIPGQSTLFADIELLRVKYQEEGPPKPEKPPTPPTTPSLPAQSAVNTQASALAGASDEEKQNVLKRMAALSGGFRLVPGSGITPAQAQPQASPSHASHPHTPTAASAAATHAALPAPAAGPVVMTQQQPQPQPQQVAHQPFVMDSGVQENALVPMGYHEQNPPQQLAAVNPPNPFHSAIFPQAQAQVLAHDPAHLQQLQAGMTHPNGIPYPPASALTPYAAAGALYHPAHGHPHAHALAPPGIPPIHPPALASLESKLENLQHQLARISTSLGVNTSANAFDPFPALNAAQVAKSWNALLSERDSLKSVHETDSTKINELQAKVTSLHEKSEKFLEENRSNLERRFDSFHDELKAKNEKIATLTTDVRRLESEVQNKQFALTESDDKARRFQTELLAEQQNSNLNKELQRQLQSVKIQLETAQTQMHQTEADTKAAATAQISHTTSQLHQTKATLEEMKASFEAERAELSSSVNALKSRVSRNDAFISTLQSQLEEAHGKLSTELTNKAQLAQQYEQAKIQIEVNKQTQDVANKSSIAALESRVELIQSECTSWQSKSKQQEEQITAQKSELAKLRNDLTQSQAALSAASATSNNGVTSSSAGQPTSEQFEQQIADAKKSEYARGYEAAREAFQNKSNQNESESQKQRAELEEKLKNSQSEVSALKSEKEEIVEQSKAYVAKLRAQLQAAEQAAASSSSSSSSADVHASNRGLSLALKDHLKGAMSTLFQSLLDAFQDSSDESATERIIAIMKPASKQILLSFANIASEFIERQQTQAHTSTEPQQHSTQPDTVNAPAEQSESVAIEKAQSTSASESATETHHSNGDSAAHDVSGGLSPPSVAPATPAALTESPAVVAPSVSSGFSSSNSIFATDDDEDSNSLFR